MESSGAFNNFLVKVNYDALNNKFEDIIDKKGSNLDRETIKLIRNSIQSELESDKILFDVESIKHPYEFIIIYQGETKPIGYALYSTIYARCPFNDTFTLLEFIIDPKYTYTQSACICLIRAVAVRLKNYRKTRIVYEKTGKRSIDLLRMNESFITICGFHPIPLHDVNNNNSKEIFSLSISDIQIGNNIIVPSLWTSWSIKSTRESIINLLLDVKQTYIKQLTKKTDEEIYYLTEKIKGLPSMGITRILTRYELPTTSKNQPTYLAKVTKDYTKLIEIEFDVKDKLKREHNICMSLLNTISSIGLIDLDLPEFPIIDVDLSIHEFPDKSQNIKVIPLGIIDRIYYDPDEKCLVLCDVKTSTFKSYSSKYESENFLRIKYACQLQLYAVILNRLLKKVNTKLRIKYCIIVGMNTEVGLTCAFKLSNITHYITNDNAFCKAILDEKDLVKD